MSSPGVYTLVLAKEDFKFSSAHFTLFGPEHAELMHGHNYRTWVELEGQALDEDGLLANIEEVKAALRAACRRLDNRTLVPTESRHLRLTHDGDAVVVEYRDRVYRLPAADVLLLPLANTSIELLAEMLWRELVPHLDPARVTTLTVHVGETPGQSCAYRAAIENPRLEP